MRLKASQVTAANLAPVLSNTRARGSNERILASNGELNAGSNTELLSRIIELSSLIRTNAVGNEVAEVASAAERQETLLAAIADPTGNLMRELGASISADITEHVARAGFMRRFLSRGEVQQGSVPRVRVRQRNVEAVLATGPTQVAPQIVRDKYIYPSEFDVIARVLVENRELNQGSADLLQEKFDEGLEGIMVKEDATFKKLADVAAPIYNTVQYFAGAFTPQVVSAMQNEVMTWSLPASSLLMSMDLLPDMNNGTAWNAVMNPVSQLEILMTGRLGTVYGMDLVTDGMRDPRLKVLDSGELYVLSTPEYVGAYTDRGPVQSLPATNTNGVLGRGWDMSESLSMAVGGAKGVCRGKRI